MQEIYNKAKESDTAIIGEKRPRPIISMACNIGDNIRVATEILFAIENALTVRDELQSLSCRETPSFSDFLERTDEDSYILLGAARRIANIIGVDVCL